MSLELTRGIDVALLVFYAFVFFFFGLVVYLRRENRREGFPLEDENGRLDTLSLVLDPATNKRFALPFGRGIRTPRNDREPVNLPVRRESFPGSPLVPTGNPLVDGIGPAAWANRAEEPDLDMEGHPRIVPMSQTNGIRLEARDANPIGMAVIAADGVEVGKVSDIWVDRADRLIRYLSVDLAGGRTILAPFFMARVKRAKRIVVIDAITAAQFADVPAIDATDRITFYEEDRIQAYFGGGYLYATPERSEPIL